MKKSVLATIIVAAIFAVTNCKPKAEAAATVKWNCTFAGTQKDAKGETLPFSWKVVWAETGTKSAITGSSADATGKSTANGSCEGSKCSVKEEYTVGELKGKTYTWAFTYEDAETKNENVYKTSISGTFSNDKEKADSGTLSAKADCTHAE